MRAIGLVLSVVGAASLTAGSSTTTNAPKEVRSQLSRNVAPDITPDELASVVAGETAFTLDVLRQVPSSNNFIYSPYSISIALSMLGAGTKGDTATQLRGALHQTLPPERLAIANNALDLQLTSRGQNATGRDGQPFRLRVTQAIWGQEDKIFAAPYLDTLATSYGAGVFVVDFAKAPGTALKTINGWASDATEGQIPALLGESDITADTQFVLTNAIDFSAAWGTPFKASVTADAPFHTAAGDITTSTLHGTVPGGFVIESGVTALELLYSGGDTSFLIVQPDDFAGFIASLTAEQLTKLVDKLHVGHLLVSLPKFKIDAELPATSILGKLGVVDAFDSTLADLSGIDGQRDLHVSSVVHKASITVDEAGTKAAAATAVIGASTTGAYSDPPKVTIDRPFLFFIRDLATGALIFAGGVADPTK